MTGLVRKATLILGVCGLLAASAALANVPDPGQSSAPQRIWVVTPRTAGALPDVDGANGPPYIGGAPVVVPGDAIADNDNVIIIRDFAGNPISDVGVHVTFPCDVNLCTLSPGAPYSTTYAQTVTSGSVLNGKTDAAGRFEFVAFGAARDPGGTGRLVGGGGFNITLITVDGYVGTFKTTSAVCLDHNGSVGPPTNSGAGVTTGEAGIVLATALSGPNSQRARADINDSGNVTTGDAGVILSHALARLASQGPTTQCAGDYLYPPSACP